MPQPGWYPDPDGTPGRLRWWDGQGWTPTVQIPANPAGTTTRPAPQPGGSRSVSAMIALGVLAVVLGVSLGMLAQPFGSPPPPARTPTPTVPVPGSESPSAAPAPTPTEKVTAEPGLCSDGIEYGRLRAGALSILVPLSDEWVESLEPAGIWTSCSAKAVRPIPGSGGSVLLAAQLAVPFDSTADTARSAGEWILDSLYGEGDLRLVSESEEELEGRNLSQAVFEITEPTGIVNQMTVLVTIDQEHEQSMVAAICVQSDPDNCAEIETALGTLHWER